MTVLHSFSCEIICVPQTSAVILKKIACEYCTCGVVLENMNPKGAKTWQGI